MDDMPNRIKQELHDKFFWLQPCLHLFDNGKDELIIIIDIFNNHLIWVINHEDGSRTECADFNDAVKKFVEGEEK